jgi:hypothetical protein
MNRPLVPGPQTPSEANGFGRLPDSAEITGFLRRLAERFPRAACFNAGSSQGGRPITAVALSRDPAALRDRRAVSAKPTVLIIGSQHGDEASGCEALTMLVRDIAQGGNEELLDAFDLVCIPLSNPDGRDLRRRGNGGDVNLAIDFLLQSQPETRAVTALLLELRPAIVLDVHETPAFKRGLAESGFLSGLETQIDVPNNPNIDPGLLGLGEHILLPSLLRRLDDAGLEATRYYGEVNRLDTVAIQGGPALRTLRNYAALGGAVSLLLENRRDPPEGAYATPENIRHRTERQYRAIGAMLEELRGAKAAIASVVDAAREGARRAAPGDAVVLNEEFAADPARPTVELPLEPLAGGPPVLRPFPYRPKVVPMLSIRLPAAYCLAAHHRMLGSLLRRHGFEPRRVRRPREVAATIVQASAPARREGAGDAPMTGTRRRLNLRPGDLVVNTRQPGAALLPLLLDPRSPHCVFLSPPYSVLLGGVETAIVGTLESLPEDLFD